MDHILSSSTAPDDALLWWTLAKRKMIIQKNGAPGGSHSAHAALLSDVPADDSDSLPALEECTDEYDDTEVSVPLSSIAFSSSLKLKLKLKLFATCAGKLDRLLSLGPLYQAIHDL
jgi:hypothetical protein